VRNISRGEIVSHALRVMSLFLILVLCAATSVPVFAQMTATLSGVITDPNGRIVPEAEVTATRIETGIAVTMKTNGAGIYVFTSLMPGHYHLLVRKPGFKEIAIKEFQLYVQDKLEQNFSLEIGSVSESVTVTADETSINTADAAVSTVINRHFVENLPLNGRSFNTLLQLTPGVVIASVASTFGTAPGQFSISGQRTDANNFTVDGVSANFGVSGQFGDPAQSGTGTDQAFSALGGTSSLVSVDALQEFRIETSSFAPEFGRSPGGQVILTTRSGTNDFHGAAFDYFRNTVMDANDWFSNAAGQPRAPEHHNDFGGVLGGPIWKDNTFFFFSYEGARLRLPQTEVIQVPSVGIRTSSSTPPQVLPFLNAYPVPNGPVSSTGDTAQFTGGVSDSGTLNATSVRIDHTFNQRFSLFGRYNYAPSQLLSNQIPILTNTRVNTTTLTIGLNMVLSSKFTNVLRGNYSTQSAVNSDSSSAFGGAIPLNPVLLIGSLDQNQTFGSFLPLNSVPVQIGPLVNAKTKQFNLVDDVSIILGAHQIKVGGDYRAIFLDTADAEHSIGQTAFTVAGFVSTGTVDFVSADTQANAQLLTQASSFYAQDTWRMNPRLTITYGLRWELVPAPTARGATTIAAWENVNNPTNLTLAPPGTPLWATTFGNVGPRFGIAYSLTRAGDFVLRAGVGSFYDLGLGTSASVVANFPNNATNIFTNVSVPLTNVDALVPQLSENPPFPDGGISAFSPNLKLPRSYQWNVALEKAFGGRSVFSLTYVGQAGRDLLRQGLQYQPNQNFLGAFDLTQNDARSNYNALQLQYRKPLSMGFQALLNYTWSHSLDNASNDVIAGTSNTVISSANDYGSSDFDVRQSFSGALTYEVPGLGNSRPLKVLTKGWSISTVVVARTGFPFNALTFSPSPEFPSSSTRPDLVPGQPFYISNSSAPGGKILNSNAFSIPSTTRQGNEGRNDIPGFGLTQVDLSLGRRFPITDRVSLQFRADAFNVLNHPNFTNPCAQLAFGSFCLQSNSMLNHGLGGLNPLFQEGGPRSLQLSLKLAF
jgi:hypothetical protein